MTLRLAKRDRGERPAAALFAEPQKAPEPAAAGVAAVLHQVLRLEVRARRVPGADAMHGAQRALLHCRLEGVHQWVQPETVVQFQRR